MEDADRTAGDTYGDFDGRRRILSARDLRVLAVVQTPLDVLFELSVALQVLPQKTDEVLRKTKNRFYTDGRASKYGDDERVNSPVDKSFFPNPFFTV